MRIHKLRAGDGRLRSLDRGRSGRCRRDHRPDRHRHQGGRNGAVHGQRVELQQDADRADGLLPAHQRPGRNPRAQVRDDRRRHRVRPGQGHGRGQEAAPPGRGLLPARQLLQRGRHGRQADGGAHRHSLDHRARGQPQHLHAGDREPQHLPRRPGRPRLRLHHGRVRHEQAGDEAHRDGHPYQRLGEVVLRSRHRGHQGLRRRDGRGARARARPDRRHRPGAEAEAGQPRLHPRLPVRGGDGDLPARRQEVRRQDSGDGHRGDGPGEHAGAAGGPGRGQGLLRAARVRRQGRRAEDDEVERHHPEVQPRRDHHRVQRGLDGERRCRGEGARSGGPGSHALEVHRRAREDQRSGRPGILACDITWTPTDRHGCKKSAVAGFVDGKPTVLSSWGKPW